MKTMGTEYQVAVISKEIKESDWEKLKYLWYSDLYRYTTDINKKTYFYALFRYYGYRITFLARLCGHMEQNRENFFNRIIYRLVHEIFIYNCLKFGFTVGTQTKIDGGLYVPHPFGVVINSDSTIGKNCNISQHVTLGKVDRGDKKGGCPVVGDNVFIGPGAVVIGKINIGNNVAIGANAVVTRDVPDNAVVAGVPAKIISFKGSQDYIKRTMYDTDKEDPDLIWADNELS